MSLSDKKRRRNLQSGRLAKANWLYKPDDVLALYQVCANTLSNWVKAGLKPYEHGRKRLFKGEVLNTFHQERGEAAKRRLGPFEAYCVACKRKHSLLDDPIEFAILPKAVMVVVKCPNGTARAPTIISFSRFNALCKLRGTNPRTETPD